MYVAASLVPHYAVHARGRFETIKRCVTGRRTAHLVEQVPHRGYRSHCSSYLPISCLSTILSSKGLKGHEKYFKNIFFKLHLATTLAARSQKRQQQQNLVTFLVLCLAWPCLTFYILPRGYT